MKKKKRTFSKELIEKAARLLKGETITETELSGYKHKLSRKK